jgi:N6-L-threonylcarbamoyladenine synthase
MRILAIETSCDETAIAIVEAESPSTPLGASTPHETCFRVLGNGLISQIDIHREFGGVFPMLAKREHAKNLVPILEAALEEAELLHEDTQVMTEETRAQISEVLAREGDLAEAFFSFIHECEPPAIDAIAVTAGPGLEPALWVGIQFAKALSLAWDKPLVPVDHMEGHILSGLASCQDDILTLGKVKMPTLALLISGGHTELVLMREWLKYELVGQTRDDAVGEAFDKVARMLELPYPGGPEISKLAEALRSQALRKESGLLSVARTGDPRTFSQETGKEFVLPRPMIHDASCDFSFAGLKTAVLYLLKKLDKSDLSKNTKAGIALEFENAVTEVLWAKTSRALGETGARTLVLGGGVSNNTHIRRVFTEKIKESHPDVSLRLPARELTTDNAVMIALAGFYRSTDAHGKPLSADKLSPIDDIRADGNQRLA